MSDAINARVTISYLHRNDNVLEVSNILISLSRQNVPNVSDALLKRRIETRALTRALAITGRNHPHVNWEVYNSHVEITEDGAGREDVGMWDHLFVGVMHLYRWAKGIR